ncbi:RagB/SusD family nutrient uptake outer membrane protein [Winogradskyella sp.]|uniref:RagB/SusD family nutrient uptake outer membrane protein n=1 Tax=Winogradskyella sp. TaxID=1883156 RepID=UPI003BAC9DDA
MKKYYITIISVLFLQFGFSQIIEVTHLSNGTVLELPIESIDSVNVEYYNSTSLKRVYQNNGNILSIAVQDIDSITFKMPNINDLPALSTTAITEESPTSLFSGGIITNNGGTPIIQRGVCWNTMPNPTIANNFTMDGTGTGNFTSQVYPLNPSTVYYVRAYAINENGTNYGNQLVFTMASPDLSAELPQVTTGDLTYDDGLTALGSGTVSIGSGTITSRGVCWAIGASPTINSSLSVEGTGAGTFSSVLEDLLPDTLYRVRAFATSDAGVAYGEEVLFRTHDLPSQFETTLNNYLTNGTVSLNMGVLFDGGSEITERGVCWSTEGIPTIEDETSSSGSGVGLFNATLTDLNSDNIYTFRVYATNGIGTSYGPITTASLDGSLSLEDIYSILYTSNTFRHDEFGQKGVDIYSDMLSGDMALSTTTYGWYNSIADLEDTTTEDASATSPPRLTYDYYFRVINGVNPIIEALSPSGSVPTNDEDQWVLGQVLALRGYAYFYLTQLYQEQYDPTEVILPLHLGGQNDVSPVETGAIYNQITSDLNSAISLLDNYVRPNKLHIDKTVAQGLLAYVYAAMGDYLNAKLLADAVISNGPPLTTTEELAFPGAGSGFNDVNTSSWLWGKDLTAQDSQQLINWWAQMDYFTYGYAWAGDTKSIDDGLFAQILSDDIRKTQFGTGYDDLQPIGKFFDPGRTEGGQLLITTDLIFMRSDEFHLLSAECAAGLGDDATARATMINLLNSRMTDANGIVSPLSGQALIDFIYLQTRIELWGEGKSYLAMKRNDATVTRGTNHLYRAGETFAHDSDELTFDVSFEDISTYTPPQLEFLDCEGLVQNGDDLAFGEAVTDFTFQIPYITQTGGDYEALSIESTGVEGLTASLDSGVFNEFEGVLEFNVTGTPSLYGTAEFDVSIDGKNCNVSFEVVVAGNCSAYPTILTINFNENPEETYWELYSTNNTSTPLFSGGINGGYSGMTSVAVPFCLEDGDYILSFFDTNGNGMSLTGNYQLEDIYGNVYACGGAFADSQSTLFTTGVETADIHDIQVQIQLDTWPDETTWEIYDLSGAPTLIISGGPYINPDDDFAVLSYDFCLPSGSYGIAVYDAYGDGGPTYSVSTGSTILVPATTVMGTQSSNTFTLN